MKVRELIEQLSEMDPEAEVWLYDGEWAENPCYYVTSWPKTTIWENPSDLSNKSVVEEIFEVPRVLLS